MRRITTTTLLRLNDWSGFTYATLVAGRPDQRVVTFDSGTTVASAL